MSVPLRFNFVLNLDTHGVLFGAGTGASGDETGTRAGTEVLDEEEEEEASSASSRSLALVAAKRTCLAAETHEDRRKENMPGWETENEDDAEYARPIFGTSGDETEYLSAPLAADCRDASASPCCAGFFMKYLAFPQYFLWPPKAFPFAKHLLQIPH